MAAMVPLRAAEVSSFQDLANPRFVTVHQGKLLFQHDGGIATVKAEPAALAAAGLDPSYDPGKIPSLTEEMQKKTQSWLLEIQTAAKNAAAQKALAAKKAAADAAAAAAAAATPPPAPVVVREPVQRKTVKSFYETADLIREYDPDLHPGKYFQVSGTITKIFENKTGQFLLLLDDRVLVTYNSSAKVKASDTSGNPRDIGDYKLGDRATFQQACRGVDAEGRVLMGN